MSYPVPRGGTSGQSQFISQTINASHATDARLHFPAGSKDIGAGDAVQSQKDNAGPEGWTLYRPLDPSFHWRYGVCGDLPSGNEHLKGGLYYNGGQIVETFNEGASIPVEMTVVANHNGYIELYICNVDNCPDNEISPECFQSPSQPCVQLTRTPNDQCDSGKSLACGPIDPNYPGRWYIPCPLVPGDTSIYTYGTDGSIQFKLPNGFYCDHCVLQFLWVSANFCNPIGVVDYFNSENKPNWGDCRGQGNAIGGVNNNLPLCGGSQFSEEYLMCSDIRILRNDCSDENTMS